MADDIAITMNIKFNEQKAIPELRAWIARGMWYGLKFFEKHFEQLVMTPMILGGPGWRSIEQTAGWKWIISSKGFGQLGFADRGEPYKLLVLLLNSYEVAVKGKPGTGGNFNIRLQWNFFDLDKLSAGTIHPAAGKLGLASDRSWFDWVYKGRAISEPAKFTKTGPRRGVRSSLTAGSDAGMMTRKGQGLWQVPPRFRLDLEGLIKANEKKILRVLEDTVVTQLQRYLSK